MEKSYKWDELKNEKLRVQRGFTFEEIVVGIEEGGLLAAIEHPNQIRYPNQIVLVVRLGDYAYAVPSVVGEESIFLKTAYPSRKLTDRYLRGKDGPS